MTNRDKILDTLLRGASDANIAFADLCGLLKRLGFAERIRGDHHIFTRDGVEEILNLQPRQGKAKPYQVKQVRAVIQRYRLAGDHDDDQ
ncbi:MAG: type II toxin-antitoxin system HicA family toxin [Planctomycetaceae bacterium]|nr:type II toxin-antitoxin system HicA family toxin [Planctomycetaceae bacterium]